MTSGLPVILTKSSIPYMAMLPAANWTVQFSEVIVDTGAGMINLFSLVRSTADIKPLEIGVASGKIRSPRALTQESVAAS